MSDAFNALRSSIANAVATRLADVKSASMTDANRKKLAHCNTVANVDDCAALLVAANYSAPDINQNVYSVEKVFDIVTHAAKKARMSIYCEALFTSALVLEKSEIEITRDVIASLCTNDIKTKYDAKIKTTRVQSVKSKSTVATQHNSTINAYLALSMLHVTRNASNEEVFKLNRENAIVKAIAANREIAL